MKHIMKNRVRNILLLFVFLFGLTFVFVTPTHAQVNLGSQTEAFQKGAGLDAEPDDPRKIVSLLVNSVLSVLGMVMVGYLIYGGYLIMTASGIEDRIARGKRSVWTSVVGAALLLSAFGISRFVVQEASNATNDIDPTYGSGDGGYVDVTVTEDPNVPNDPLFDEEFRQSNWGEDGVWTGDCFGPLCE